MGEEVKYYGLFLRDDVAGDATRLSSKFLLQL